MAIQQCGLPGNPASQETGKRRGKARHRQFPFLALPYWSASSPPAPLPGLLSRSRTARGPAGHTRMDPRAGSGTAMSRTSLPSRCRAKN